MPKNIMMNVVGRLRALTGDDRAQDLMEYGLLVGLIALVAIVGVTGVGTAADTVWTGIVAGLKAAL
jgi:Flp pilus assembly pilin Flp